MTRNEALDVVSMLSSHWPGNQWTSQTMDAYARAIEWMDPEMAMKAVLRAVQTCEFYPKVSVLREFYGIEKRMAEPEPPIERMLNNTPSQIMPAWVRGYIISRVRHRDFRVWGEQHNEGLKGDLMPQEARDAYISEAAGLPVTAMFKQIVTGEA